MTSTDLVTISSNDERIIHIDLIETLGHRFAPNSYTLHTKSFAASEFLRLDYKLLISNAFKYSDIRLFLNEKIDECSYQNSQLARKIIHSLRKVVSCNYMSRNYEKDFSEAVFMGALLSTQMAFLKNTSDRLCAQIAKQLEVGNCGQMALIAFFDCLDSGTLVEVITIKNGQHELLAIGRDPNTDPDNYHSWNSSVVICDPWARKYYPLFQLESQLYDYVGCVFNPHFVTCPLIRKFDPNTQSLSVVLTVQTDENGNRTPLSLLYPG